MKILYIILFIQIGWIFPLSAQKQDSIYIGTRHTLFSEILNEDRKYWIYVPETKAGEKGKAYPVLYLLDGDSFFHSVVGFPPLFCRHAEHGNVQHVGFVGIDDACLRPSNFCRDKVLFYGIGMYAVVDFRQFTFR